MRQWIPIRAVHPVVNDATDCRIVRRMTQDMREHGFNTHHPVVVIPSIRKHQYILIDGRHRRQSAKAAGLKRVYADVVPVEKWYPTFDPIWFIKEVLKPARKKGLL